MSNTGTAKPSSRELALERRRALSTGGKAALGAKATSGSRRIRPAKPESDATVVARPARSSSRPAPVAESAPAPAAGNRPRRRAAVDTASTAKKASLERRLKLSRHGKSADRSNDRTRNAEELRKAAEAKASAPAANEAAEADKKDCGCGCGGRDAAKAETRAAKAVGRKRTSRAKKATVASTSSTRALALARRKAQSTRGKAGTNGSGVTAAQTARATNPDLSSRELAIALREQRSKRGRGGEKAARPTGRVRPNPAAEQNAAAKDQPWKVGASETVQGQTVTGTMTGRSNDVTGDEASTCRSITGTEYMGADVFREFCQTDPNPSRPAKVARTSTSRGNGVTGNEVGRSTKVTGDEPGTCKTVTGTEYMSAGQSEAFCGTQPPKSPAKVAMSKSEKGKGITGAKVEGSAKVTGNETGSGRALTGDQYVQPADKERPVPSKVGAMDTLRGGRVTGSRVGSREHMTGDEAGSCRNITGDEYLGREQFEGFCESTPKPEGAKVGVSTTLKGEGVTGTMTGPSRKMTGDEPGVCKAVTGTPYAGLDQYQGFCEPAQQSEAAARMTPMARRNGKAMTGQQPGIGGVMTGADKGACNDTTGTPYVGADQAAQACPAQAAEPGSPDFPQMLNAAGATPWGDFSVEAPNHASDTLGGTSRVTGAEAGHSSITGPFGMANGKVTGTEEARFGAPAPMAAPETAPEISGRVKSRISGEGMDAGARITGDDWDRGDRVTGTEGMSAKGRNPSRRGSTGSVMPAAGMRRSEDVPEPVSPVTGSSGNTASGSLITYSGGARG